MRIGSKVAIDLLVLDLTDEEEVLLGLLALVEVAGVFFGLRLLIFRTPSEDRDLPAEDRSRIILGFGVIWRTEFRSIFGKMSMVVFPDPEAIDRLRGGFFVVVGLYAKALS